MKSKGRFGLVSTRSYLIVWVEALLKYYTPTFYFFLTNFIEAQLIYNVLISLVQKCDSILYIYN